MKSRLLPMGFALTLALSPFGLCANVEANTTTEIEASVNIVGGSFNLVSSLAGPIDLGTMELNASSYEAVADIGNFTINDYTGTGEGWKFSVSADRLTSNAMQLPINTLSIDSTGLTHDGTNGQGEVAVTNGKVFIDNGSSHILAEASQGNGFGSHLLNFTEGALQFAFDLIDAENGQLVDNEYGNTYETTITFTLTKGI